MRVPKNCVEECCNVHGLGTHLSASDLGVSNPLLAAPPVSPVGSLTAISSEATELGDVAPPPSIDSKIMSSTLLGVLGEAGIGESPGLSITSEPLLVPVALRSVGLRCFL